MLLALLPLIAQFGPMLAGWLGGPRDGAIAAQIGAAVTAVTGVVTGTSDSTATAMAALAGKPELAAQLTQRLAEIHAEEVQAQTAAITAQIIASAQSQADARAYSLGLVKAGTAMAWGAPILSGIILGSFAAMLWVVLTRAVPESSQALANILLGTLAAMATQVANYWLGSSAGSSAKNETIASAANALATSMPGGAAPRPLSK